MKLSGTHRRETALIDCLCRRRCLVGTGTGVIRAFIVVLSIGLAILVNGESAISALAGDATSIDYQGLLSPKGT